jgi:hypothetical protein
MIGGGDQLWLSFPVGGSILWEIRKHQESVFRIFALCAPSLAKCSDIHFIWILNNYEMIKHSA